MGLISGKADVKASFLKEWKKYVPAIVTYGKKRSVKNVQHDSGTSSFIFYM